MPSGYNHSVPRILTENWDFTTQMDHDSLLRILDANANRAAEALRVVEDVVRFTRNDGVLSQRYKVLRHDLSELIAEIAPLSARCQVRDILGDVGTENIAHDEYARESTAELIATNSQRALQAIRVLEEAVKLLQPKAAKSLEALRYRTYELERTSFEPRVLIRKKMLETARLCILLPAFDSLQDFQDQAERLYAAGADMLQLRAKSLTDRDLYQRAQALVAAARKHDKLAIVNDRADIAAAVDAHGAHIGQEELPPSVVRRLLGEDRLLGISTHSLDQAREAVRAGADYIGVGPTFPSQTKNFADFPGTKLISRIAAEIAIPAFAIGGISADNLETVLAAGSRRIAVASAVLAAPAPPLAITPLKIQLARYPLDQVPEAT